MPISVSFGLEKAESRPNGRKTRRRTVHKLLLIVGLRHS